MYQTSEASIYDQPLDLQRYLQFDWFSIYIWDMKHTPIPSQHILGGWTCFFYLQGSFIVSSKPGSYIINECSLNASYIIIHPKICPSPTKSCCWFQTSWSFSSEFHSTSIYYWYIMIVTINYNPLYICICICICTCTCTCICLCWCLCLYVRMCMSAHLSSVLLMHSQIFWWSGHHFSWLWAPAFCTAFIAEPDVPGAGRCTCGADRPTMEFWWDFSQGIWWSDGDSMGFDLVVI